MGKGYGNSFHGNNGEGKGSGKPLIIGHNLLYDLTWLKVLKGFDQWDYEVFDTLIALHLLDENYPDKSLQHQYLKLTGRGYEKPGKVSLHSSSTPLIENLREDARRDAHATAELFRDVYRKLEQGGLERIAWLDNEVLKTVVDVTARGWKVDGYALDSGEKALLDSLHNLESTITINPRSPKQVSRWVFGREDAPTDEACLRAIKDTNPRASRILEHRELSKQEGTYYRGLKRYVYEDGRVHAWYHLAPSPLGNSTVTGRLSSSKPNMQNQPPETRHLFIPSNPDWAILTADSQQLELRIIAEVTRDPTLLRYIHEGRDLHEETAIFVADLKGEPYDRGIDRYGGKTTNFAWVYGASNWQLARTTGLPNHLGKELSHFLTEKFPGVTGWIEDTKDRIRTEGVIRNIFGRRRRLGVHDNFETPEGRRTLRQALNSPIQGGAGDLVKFIMWCIHRKFLTLGLESGIINTVHDEIDIDLNPKEEAIVREIVEYYFTSPPTEEYLGYKLVVPLGVEIGVGKNWKEAKV